MGNKALLAKAIRTLIYSWGGGPYPEALWTYEDLRVYVNAEFGQNFLPLDGEEMTDENVLRVEELLAFLGS
jgi:hypothetical protein